MFIHFQKVGDLTSFQDILPRNLFKKAESFRDDLSIIFLEPLTESESKFIKGLATKFGAQIYEGSFKTIDISEESDSIE